MGFASQFWDLFVGRSWSVITVNEYKIEADWEDSGIENDLTKRACIVSGLCKLALSESERLHLNQTEAVLVLIADFSTCIAKMCQQI